MKILLFVLISGLFCVAFASGGQTATPGKDETYLTNEERAKAIKLLRDSEKEFLDMVSNITDEQWVYKPALNRWSVGEVAQHIMLTEGLLFGTMERALASPENPEWKAKTGGKNEFLERVLVSRERRAQAPEPIRPLQKISRADVMSRFKEGRAKTLKFIEETKLPMKAHTVDHPFPVFSTLNAYQWLIYIPLHNLRHNQQIAEVKASANFPKGK
jgi:hypothetical protein